MADHNQLTRSVANSTSSASTTRRALLKGFAAAGAAVSMVSKVAWADGEIGYWAKDLPNEKLIDMYSDHSAHPMVRAHYGRQTAERPQLPQAHPSLCRARKRSPPAFARR